MTTSVLKAFESKLSSTNWERLFELAARRERTIAAGFSTSEAKTEANRDLNRWSNILPYDHSRVSLKGAEREYINANRLPPSYILTQGPLDTTIGDFWRMVAQEKVRNVVMLCEIIENRFEKCAAYWPESPGDSITQNGIKVEYVKLEERKNYRLRTLLLRKPPDEAEILQFHFSGWPDFGVPKDYAGFLNFLADVNEAEDRVKADNIENADDAPPILVHCSAGIGRSGSYVLVDTCLKRFRESGRLKFEDVEAVLDDMRKRRRGLIQTDKQMEFAFRAIYEGMKREAAKEEEAAKSQSKKRPQPENEGEDEKKLENSKKRHMSSER